MDPLVGSGDSISILVGGVERLTMPGTARGGAVRRLLDCKRVRLRAWRRRADVNAVHLRTHLASLSTAWWASHRGLPVVLEAKGTHTDGFESRCSRCSSAVPAMDISMSGLLRVSQQWQKGLGRGS